MDGVAGQGYLIFINMDNYLERLRGYSVPQWEPVEKTNLRSLNQLGRCTRTVNLSMEPASHGVTLPLGLIVIEFNHKSSLLIQRPLFDQNFQEVG
ncbi:hypothetical protein L2E82_19869 [Cichorium intybus]|uniref:Uncharacterized protein n=1 Tax=Cichorium intybus TaxID=13427 RepID=A0ACB9DSJ8_CICIN|nr:hypothetical protein L2E82_19869 [Cichorium intybus]